MPPLYPLHHKCMLHTPPTYDTPASSVHAMLQIVTAQHAVHILSDPNHTHLNHDSGTKAMTQTHTYHILAVRTARRAVALQ